MPDLLAREVTFPVLGPVLPAQTIGASRRKAVSPIVADHLSPHRIDLDERGWAAGQFYGCRLISEYQSIGSAQGRDALGWEAYVRVQARGGDALAPWSVFSLAADGPDLVRLDRLCRTLHVLNAAPLLEQGKLLFLNVHPLHIEAVQDGLGRVFADILAELGRSPHSCVIEIKAGEPREWTATLRHAGAFRERGFRVAIDLGHHAGFWLQPMFDRDGWKPDFVKLEPALWMLDADVPARLARWREAGVRSIATRLESPRAVRLAARLGLDATQGHAVSLSVLSGDAGRPANPT
jgi:EAL domain-containing protein (putative c-di-GMP-specific phosphodiesterase class I)